MKKIIVITTLAIIISSIFLVVSKNLKGRRVRAFSLQTPSSSHSDETNLIHRTEGKAPYGADIKPRCHLSQWEWHRIPNREERLGMTRKERLELLENLGCIPIDPDWSDYEIAEQTSWWGRRLDPQLFWKDKVIWLDATAMGEARRQGRGLPPIPYDDPSVTDISDEDELGTPSSLEGPNIRFVSSKRERAFWNKFVRTHPLLPREIIRWQTERANRWLDDINVLTNRPEHAARLRLTEASSERTLESDRYHASLMGYPGYPAECISAEAYRWAHIMQKRKEYEEIQAKGENVDSLGLTNLFRRVYVDRKYITEPLSAEDLHAANAWKREYLRRLRRENTDESYINAYMKEWGLSSNEVFGITHEGEKNNP